MSMREHINNFTFLPGFAPVVLTNADTPQVSAVIDTQGYDSCAFLIQTGVLTDADATFAVLIEDDDAAGFGTGAAVDDVYLEPLESVVAFNFGDDGIVRKIAYRGPKRYVRCTVTPTNNNSGAAPLSCMVMLGRPHEQPQAGNA